MTMLYRARSGCAALTLVWLAITSPVFAVANETDEPAALRSAFFGLDNALPFLANMLCLGASGLDGMPVVLSHTIDPETLEAEDFQVVTQSGAKQTPHCVTLRPAQDPGELRTVLLIGEFGNANDDPPGLVRVVGDLMSDGSRSKGINFRGSDVAVTPLDNGPSLVLAERIAVSNLAAETRGTLCPEGVQEVVRVTWAGGVRRPNREELGDAERMLYRVTVICDKILAPCHQRPRKRRQTRRPPVPVRIWLTAITTIFCVWTQLRLPWPLVFRRGIWLIQMEI